MKRTLFLLSIGLAVTLSGCGGRQRYDTAPPAETEPVEPQTPTDYLGRVGHDLQGAGIDPGGLACNSHRRWGDTLHDDAESFARDAEAFFEPYVSRRMRRHRDMIHDQITEVAMNWFIRTLLINGNLNNLGAVVLNGVQWTDEAGATHPLVVFHTGTTPAAEEPNSCVRSLIRDGRVRHVINLYDGNVPLRDLLDSERAVSEEMGASYVDAAGVDLNYSGWRNIAGNSDATDEERQEAADTVARLIREQILQPDGAAPQGNVYFHCAGGMHRSPLVMGILRRCVAGESMETVEEAMRFHAAYTDEERQGGWEPPIAAFVAEFDCALLQLAGEAEEAPAETEEAPEEAPGDEAVDAEGE